MSHSHARPRTAESGSDVTTVGAIPKLLMSATLKDAILRNDSAVNSVYCFRRISIAFEPLPAILASIGVQSLPSLDGR